MTIQEAKEQAEAELLRLPNVVGVGLGEKANRPVIVVLVTHKVPAADLAPHERIPPVIAGHETDVVPVGTPSSS